MSQSDQQPEGARGAASSGSSRLETAAIERAYEQHAAEIFNFLRGVLRDASAADDCLQVTFVKAIESADTVDPASLKCWLFRVAFNAAMEYRRRQQTGQRVVERLGANRSLDRIRNTERLSPLETAAQAEEIARLRRAFEHLPTEQQAVARLRVFEQKTFATIAAELNVPLGTVLTRMRSALEKLRRALAEET